MSTVDCRECSKNFLTSKHYIQHLLTENCTGKRKPEDQVSVDQEYKRIKTSQNSCKKKIQTVPDSTTIERKPVYGTGYHTPPSKQVVNKSSVDLKKISSMKSVNTKSSSQGDVPFSHQTPKQPIATPKPEKSPCSLCNKMMKPRGITQHMNMQHKCRYCNILVGNVGEHIMDTHEREPCAHCGKKFESEASVAKHIENTHLQRCEYELCEEEFYSEENLKAHVVDIHESEECDICNIKFLIADNTMDEHKDKVHGIKTKTIKHFGSMMFMMVSD